jgi:hypothetical protein
MWITADVELPTELLESQQASRLVVFAGAGISIDSPSNMPSFRELIEAIAGEAGEPEVPDWTAVPPDIFLGRLVKNEFPVHERVAARLTPSRKQKPNVYHLGLVGLFRNAESLRIVTTNHDPFLTTAASRVFGDEVPSFYAPALPVGDDFAGIVYLHGAVVQNAANLVLTDRDFGRAYLTQGWATAFLRGMYSAFDVVFIGYSHGEPVLRYLASGLSARARRYAFDVSDRDKSLWDSIGVDRIDYPRHTAPGEHVALREVVATWSERTRMGYLEHEALIRDAVGGLPPLDVAVADYIRQALGDPATARFFARYASAPEWLDWVKDVPQFRALFGQEATREGSAELATWFAERCMLSHSEQALAVLQELGGRMTPELWFACAHRLWTSDPRPKSSVFAKWVTALIESTPAIGADRYLGYLLTSCRWPDDRSAALLLFSHLTDPHPEFDTSFFRVVSDDEGLRVRVSIAIRGDADQLRDAWTVLFRPHLDELAEQLEPIVASQLVRAHEIMKASGDADDTWDPTSLLVRRIEETHDDE